MSAGYSNSAFTSGLINTVNPSLLAAQDIYSASAGLSYVLTPFLAGSVNWQYSERVFDHLVTPQDLITVSLNYKPY